MDRLRPSPASEAKHALRHDSLLQQSAPRKMHDRVANKSFCRSRHHSVDRGLRTHRPIIAVGQFASRYATLPRYSGISFGTTVPYNFLIGSSFVVLCSPFQFLAALPCFCLIRSLKKSFDKIILVQSQSHREAVANNLMRCRQCA